MTVERRIRQTLTIAAGAVAPPHLEVAALRSRAIHVRRRMLTVTTVVAAVAVVLAILLLPQLVHRDSAAPPVVPSPRQPHRS